MRKVNLLLPLLSLISGCQPPLTRVQQLEIYQSRCDDYGYERGTPDFANCMMKQESRQEAMAIQLRKVGALEESNWIEQQKMRADEDERKHKRTKKPKN